MSDQHDDLRGSTPIYTAKEILQSLDRKVTEMDLKVDGFIMSLQIIVSQNLNERLQVLESQGSKGAQDALRLATKHEEALNQVHGMTMMMKALFGSNVIVLIIAVLSIINQVFGVQGTPP